MKTIPSIDIVVYDPPDTSTDAFAEHWTESGFARIEAALRQELEAEGADPGSIKIGPIESGPRVDREALRAWVGRLERGDRGAVTWSTYEGLTSTAQRSTLRGVNDQNETPSEGQAISNFQHLRIQVEQVAEGLALHGAATLPGMSDILATLEAAVSSATGLVEDFGGAPAPQRLNVDDVAVASYQAGVLRGIEGRPLQERKVILLESGAATPTAVNEAAHSDDVQEVMSRHSLERLQDANRAIAETYRTDLEILLAHRTTDADKIGLIKDYVRTKLPRVLDEIAKKITQAHK